MSNFKLVESFVKKLSNGSELSVCAFGFNSRNWWITFYLRGRKRRKEWEGRDTKWKWMWENKTVKTAFGSRKMDR